MQVSAGAQNRWSRHWVFILAVAGSTAGLGNVWKFPYLLSENGGLVFLLMYLACLLLLGVPMMMAELALGRAGKGSPLNALSRAIEHNQTSKHWLIIALLSLLTGFLVFAFYSVVSGWVLGYFFSVAAGSLADAGSLLLEQSFLSLLDDPVALAIWHSFFMILVCSVLIKGVRGLDHAIRVLMPTLLVLLSVLLLAAVLLGDLSNAVAQLVGHSFSEIGYTDWVTALSHAFFTLSLGMGVLLAYGRYVPESIDLGRSVVLIVLFDTLIALLFGFVVYSFIADAGLTTERGPGLLFISMPFVFDTMQVGYWLSACFFLAVTVVAWTSTVALLEPWVQSLVERFRWSRTQSVIAIGIAVWGLGVLALLSFNLLQDWQMLGMTLFDLLDFISAKVLLPVTALLLVTFVGWQVKPQYLRDALATRNWVFNTWLLMMRFVVPVLLVMVISSSLQSRF